MKRKQTRTDLAEQLREAFHESGLSRFAWAKQSSVGYSVVHRFVAGERDLKLGTASKLAEVLRLELGPVSSRSKATKR